MAWGIECTPEALDDLKALRTTDQARVLEGVESQLRYQPMEHTRNRKRLRSNPVAEWELRLGRFRVFYNADKQSLIVSIAAIGLKIGNLLFIRDKGSEL